MGENQFQNDVCIILVDVQKDFCPGGSLPVPEGDGVVDVILKLLPHFKVIVTSQDWHPPDHCSFADPPQFVDKSWPVHCVQNSTGAEFNDKLNEVLRTKEFIPIHKGVNKDIEAYSAFEGTELDKILKEKGVRKCVVMGLATDYCVRATALDAIKNNFETDVISDACRGITEDSINKSVEDMKTAGCIWKTSDQLLSELSEQATAPQTTSSSETTPPQATSSSPPQTTSSSETTPPQEAPVVSSRGLPPDAEKAGCKCILM